MAKKASKKKALPFQKKKKPAPVNAKPAKKGAGKIGKIKSPRSQALPGMEKVRNIQLDKITEAIADERRTKNAALNEEKTLKSQAEKEMQRKNITVYENNGVELVMVPGAPSLRVRLVKQTGEASVEDGTSSNGGGDESDGEESGDGDGQDVDPGEEFEPPF